MSTEMKSITVMDRPSLTIRVKLIQLYYAIIIIEINEVDIRIYLPEKAINIILRVDKSLCLLKLKTITVLLYDFSYKNENCSILHFQMYINSLNG